MDEEKRLLVNYQALNQEGRRMLLEFSEFLCGKYSDKGNIPESVSMPATTPAPRAVPEPEPIPRPAQESVVGAMKRLSKSYYMVDRNKIFGQASTLMTEHMIQGRDVVEVIDELEMVFQRQYEQMVAGERDN